MFKWILLIITILLFYDAWHHFKEEKGEWAIIFLLAGILTFVLFLVSY